ncbi:MAG: hypothetical protein GY815_11395 [Gammaproteobacteria bacterium]|nr:hypothetical protein [Gammaproteobacteria bacterium]
MSSDDADNSRLLFLTAATVVAGTVMTALPFVASWSPNTRAKTVGAPVEANIGMLEPDQQKNVGTGVIIFPFVFLILAYPLKKEYWKDVH